MNFHKDGSVTKTAKKLRSTINNQFISIIDNHRSAISDSYDDSEETCSQEVSSK